MLLASAAIRKHFCFPTFPQHAVSTTARGLFTISICCKRINLFAYLSPALTCSNPSFNFLDGLISIPVAFDIDHRITAAKSKSTRILLMFVSFVFRLSSCGACFVLHAIIPRITATSQTKVKSFLGIHLHTTSIMMEQ